MAFGRLSASPAARPMSEINMTPLIDVMLVLLVIFMLAAPLMSTSLRLELPQSPAATPSAAPQTLAVALTPEGELLLQGQALSAADFQARIQALARANAQLEVQLRADRRVPYGRVAELIGWLQAAGLSRIAFVTDAAPSAPFAP